MFHACIAAVVVIGQPAIDPDRPFPLMIGDQAPPMNVKYYLRRERPEELKPGRPYVVDFWATWCVPCVASFPHLTELQKKYKDKATVLAVSVWEPRPNEVPAFIEKQGERMGFLAAMDSCPPAPADVENPSEWAKENGKMSVAWLRASGTDGIPTTFIVDSQNRIAWIGHHSEMDGPLEQVVAGTWDLKPFAESHRTRMRLRAKAQPLQVQQFKARHSQDWSAALAALDQLIALDASFASYAATKFEVLLTGIKDSPRAYAFAREAVDGLARQNAEAMRRIARIIVADTGPDRDLELAFIAAKLAVTLTEEKDSASFAVLASVHAARDNFESAVVTQQHAVRTAEPADKPEMEAKLKDYQARRR